MPRGFVGPSVRAVGTLAGGAAVTVVTSWAVGRLVQSDAIVRPSRRLYEDVRRRRTDQLTRRMDPVTTIGDYAVVGLVSGLVGGLIAYERRSWRPLPLLAGGALAEIYLQRVLQQLVHGSLPPRESSIGPPGDFPSGGAARTVITFGLLAHLLGEHYDSRAERRALWSIVIALTAAQGGSRLYLGRHWPEDIAGGWLFGWLILRTLIRTDRQSCQGTGAA